MKVFFSEVRKELAAHFKGRDRKGLLLFSGLFYLSVFSLAWYFVPAGFADFLLFASPLNMITTFFAGYFLLLCIMVPIALRLDLYGELTGREFRTAKQYRHTDGGNILAKYVMSVLFTAVAAAVTTGAFYGIFIAPVRINANPDDVILYIKLLAMGIFLLCAIVLLLSSYNIGAVLYFIPTIFFAACLSGAILIGGMEIEDLFNPSVGTYLLILTAGVDLLLFCFALLRAVKLKRREEELPDHYRITFGVEE